MFVTLVAVLCHVLTAGPGDCVEEIVTDSNQSNITLQSCLIQGQIGIAKWMSEHFTGGADRKAGLIAGVPLKRAGKPEEIARAIVYLASDNASFVTGQILGVNGGKTAS